MSSSTVRSPAFIALGSSILLLGALLVVPLPAKWSSASELAFHDALHFPFFIVLLVLVYAILRRLCTCGRKSALLIAVLSTSALGAGSEWAQSLSSRTASWQDFLFDLLGVAAGATLLIAWWLRGTRAFKAGLVALLAVWVSSGIVATRPALFARKAEKRQVASFPQLGDFEEDWETAVWLAQGEGGEQPTEALPSSANVTRGRSSLKIETHGNSWAGIRVLLGTAIPWPESRTLSFDLFNPEDEFTMGIRLDGSDGRRFVGEVQIAPGPNRCRVAPVHLTDGKVNLTQPASFSAASIVFHLGESATTRSFYLDNVRVE